MATTDFAPPEGISAAMGGIVLTESVRSEHKVAWLIEAAIGGAVELVEEDGKTVKIVRTAPGDPATQQILDTAFAGRTELELGSYDKSFAAGWGQVGGQLEAWSKSSDLWDRAGDRRRVRCACSASSPSSSGPSACSPGAAAAATDGTAGIVVDVIAALLAGAGIAATVRAWELRVRTPKGSGTFLRVESFRRFLHESEALARGGRRQPGRPAGVHGLGGGGGRDRPLEEGGQRLDRHPPERGPRLRLHGPAPLLLDLPRLDRPVVLRRRRRWRLQWRRRRRRRRQLVAAADPAG